MDRRLIKLLSHGDLRADFDDPAGRNLEEVRRIARRLRQHDEETVLPARHAGMGGGFQRAAGQEKRRRHDVEMPAELAGDRQRFRHVGRFHIAEFERDLAE